ncbi:MAG: AIDA repeat-containing protein [Lentisphaeria bacterium]|nr:AIDA repeat-containing protein [Lentisphaeria bacterium]
MAYIISSGITSDGIILNNDSMTVLDGGIATDTTVNSGGGLYVSSGGSANNTTVNSAGYLIVYNGGIAAGIVENGGYVDVCEGASATFASHSFSGLVLSNTSATIHSGTTANGTVNYRGSLFVYCGGTANSTTVNSYGSIFVYSDGTANSTTVNSYSFMFVYSGGTANSTKVNSRGSIHVSIRGTANSTTVNEGGWMYISEGGTATAIVENGGYVTIESGAKVSFVENTFSDLVLSGVAATVHSGTTARNVTIKSGVSLDVFAGGFASLTTIRASGYLRLFSGGLADNTTISPYGNLVVSSGGIANSTTVYDVGFVDVSCGGIANNTIVDTASILNIFSGGTANQSLVKSGSLKVSSGGLANSTTIAPTGTLWVSSGGIANSSFVSGYLFVSSGGTAMNTVWTPCEGHVTISDGGYVTFASQYSGIYYGSDNHLLSRMSSMSSMSIDPSYEIAVMSKGIANGVIVDSGGTCRILWDGHMDHTTVNEYGSIFISSGGTARFITVREGGSLEILSSGLITGRIIFEDGAIVSATQKAIVDFDISSVAPEMSARINNLTIIQGTPCYTITVSASQENGLYLLANHADYFNSTLAIHNTLGDYLGLISVDETVEINKVSYKLNLLKDNSLVLSITGNNPADTIAPTVSNIQASTTELTNQDVVLTADFADDVELASSLYKLGETGEWSEYGGGVTVTTNTMVYFKAVDMAGNESEVAVYEVTNIDKTPPEKPVATADVTEPTNMDVLVTATFSEDSVVKQYSFDCENWGTYPGGVLVGTNLTVYFRGIDAAGNVSESAEYEVTNVDRSAPVITLTGDNQTPASEVLLTAETDDGSALYYCVDDSGWKEYTETITVTANGSYSFRATDAAGNTAISEILFANIKITAPVNLVGTADGLSWEYPAGAAMYMVDLSTNDFGQVFRWLTDTTAQDLYELPGGTYQWRVKVFDDGEDWAVGEDFVSENEPGTAKVVRSNADGVDDIFFASANGTWSREYFAQHAGSLDEEGWTGTGEFVSANGKGRIQNLFFGSSDPSILCLTDGENGDAIFLDDVYTELPEEIEMNTARLLQIREIRAGAGDDIIDMTSQRFEYVGDGQTLCGGDGNDVIWANKGANWLFGDAGNDRITGASGNDVIAGGIGDDRLHGGGGNDVFTFCENWGSDTVKQLGTGTVTLWFNSGSIDNWDEETLTYSDGTNSVKVSGVSKEQIELKFGAGTTPDDADQFASLSNTGAFEAFTTRKIFEEATLA